MKICIIGADDIGLKLIEKFSNIHTVSIIDADPEKCAYVAAHHDAFIYQGDASNKKVLDTAKLPDQDIVIITIFKGGKSYEIAELLKSEYGVPRVISVVDDSGYNEKFANLGVDVINIVDFSVREIESTILQEPSTIFDENKIKMAKLVIKEQNEKIGEDYPEKENLTVVVQRGDSVLFSKQIIQSNDTVYLFGSKKSVDEATSELK